MGTHLRALSERYPMNTNMSQGLGGYQISLHVRALDEIRLSNERVQTTNHM